MFGETDHSSLIATELSSRSTQICRIIGFPSLALIRIKQQTHGPRQPKWRWMAGLSVSIGAVVPLAGAQKKGTRSPKSSQVPVWLSPMSPSSHWPTMCRELPPTHPSTQHSKFGGETSFPLSDGSQNPPHCQHSSSSRPLTSRQSTPRILATSHLLSQHPSVAS